MKHSAAEVLRRGFDSTLANWPLILIRIAEGIVFVAIGIAAVVAAVVPIVVAAGLSKFDISGSSNPAEVVAAAFMQHWILFVYLLLILTLLFGVLVAIHSFVEAGTAQVFVDAERRAKPVTAPRRDVFSVFSIDRWMAGGRQRWWSVFWIYNATWSVAGLIILIPLLVTMVLMLAVGDTAGRVVTGCGGLLLTVIVAIPVGVVTAIWTQKAITICVARAATAGVALRSAWDEMRADFGRHLAVAFVLFMISVGGAMVISMLSLPFQIGQQHHAVFSLAFAPLQFVSSFAQTIFSAAISAWFLASFVALTEDR